MASLLLDNNAFPFHGLDDDSFNLEIFELQNGPVHFNFDRLTSLNYNPLLSNADRHLTLSSDLDPDSHFYNNLNNCCDYYIEDQFNELVKNEAHNGTEFSILI